MSQNSDNSESRPRSLEELVDNVRVAWSLLRDGRVSPMLRFGIPVLVIAYIVMPIDILPDIVPGLGQIDDLAAIWLGLHFLLKSAPDDIVAEYRGGSSTDNAAGTVDPDVVEGDYRVVDE